MSLLSILFPLQIITVLFLYWRSAIYIKAHETANKELEDYKQGYQLAFFTPVSMYIYEQLNLIEKAPRSFLLIHHKQVALHGQHDGLKNTKFFIMQVLSAFILTILVSTFIGIASGDVVIFCFGIGIAIFMPFILINRTDKQIIEKQNRIRIDLPELLDKMTLLINAGETAQRAFILSVNDRNPAKSHFFQRELQRAKHQIDQQVPLQHVLEELSKRCGVQEVSIFTTTVLLNYRLGGNKLVAALRELSKQLWEKRKIMTKTLGEQASSKLVFPMVLIFLTILMIIATPAIMLF